MITLKSTEDLNKLSPDDPAHATVTVTVTVKELIEQLITAYSPPGRAYDAEDDGYIILIEPEDAQRELDELWDGCTLLNIPWEGIMLQGDFFIAIYLANNEYGLTFVIENADWVTGELREMIEDILDPLPTDTQEQTHEQI
jgi:hypothetical protein